jgi:hypothetical protein
MAGKDGAPRRTRPSLLTAITGWWSAEAIRLVTT